MRRMTSIMLRFYTAARFGTSAVYRGIKIRDVSEPASKDEPQ